ncbi:hypothetical protein C2S52_022798 [Perilla frutescens var. hirtella]|nr:hypothetical protein C2S52_022798 [Perilla frutescens var. hirtella]
MEALFGRVPEAEEMNVLYSQIKADPGFLLAFEKKQFVETPLHYAASEGRKQLALEIQRLMPSMGMKLNGDGFSPLHLALQRGHFETVRSMIRLNPKLVCVQGREGITPLHYAAETDNDDMLALFLICCPESIEKLTVRMETAAHVAVNGQNLAAFEVLVGWMKWNGKGDVLNWMDWEGNTVLHLAAFINQPQFMEALGKISNLDVNAKNCRGLTALDTVMQLPYYEHINRRRALSILRSWRRRAKTGASVTLTPLADDLKSDIPLTDYMIARLTGEHISSETRNAGLVVAALIASATYQVLLSPSFMNTGSGDQAPIILNVTSFHANNTTFPVAGLDVLKAQEAHNLSNPQRVGVSPFEIAVFVILIPNSLALASSIVVMIRLLPWHSFNILLLLSLMFLIISASSVLLSNTIIVIFLSFVVVFGSIWVKSSALKREMKMARYLALP